MLECASTACKSRGGKHLAHLVSHACRRGSCKCCVQRFCAEARSRLTLARALTDVCGVSRFGSCVALPLSICRRGEERAEPTADRGATQSDTKSRKMRWHAGRSSESVLRLRNGDRDNWGQLGR